MNLEQTVKKLAIRGAAAVAKKAAAALVSWLAATLGIPVALVVLCLILGVAAFGAVFGALPQEARNTPDWQGYVALAEQYAVPARSEDGMEERFQVTPGLIMALDVVAGHEPGAAFAEVADLLLPRFSYESRTLSGTDPATGRPVVRKVTLLVRAVTYKGMATFDYRCEMEGTEVVVTLESESFTPDAELKRLVEALERLTGHGDVETARAVVELAKAIDEGRPIPNLRGGM